MQEQSGSGPQIAAEVLPANDAIIRDLLAHSLETAVVDQNGWHDVGAGPGSDAGEFIDWLTFADPTSA